MDLAFDYLPKTERNYSWTHILDDITTARSRLMCHWHERRDDRPGHQQDINALKKADWLVVGELYPDETSELWRAAVITADEQKTINTTVYRLPCAGFAEKDGSMTNSARWVTWKYAAVPPPGEARLDQDIVAQIFLRVRDLRRKRTANSPTESESQSLTRTWSTRRWRKRPWTQWQGAGGPEGR